MKTRVTTIISGAAITILLATAALAMSSANYSIDRDVISGGGGGAASTNYQMPDSATGQSSALGDSASTNYKLTGGYFAGGSNSPPVAQNASITVAHDTPYNGTLNATDADSDPLTFTIVANCVKGIAVITNAATGVYTYTPFNGQSGSDSFTFKASDGTDDSNTATISVTIQAGDTTPPQLTVSAPAENAIVSNALVIVTGTATDAGGIRGVTVNGNNAAMNGTGFTGSAALLLGANDIIVVATDNAGNPATVVRRVYLVKAGDCDGSGSVSIAEVQAAINMYLGIMPVSACVDSDNSGNISIAEVQKVINGYLGL
jgi:hypothetical protein